jgi:hypothetical protein
MPDVMRQAAPYPDALAELVAQLRYRRHLGWRVWLDDDLQRDPPGTHAGESRGMTLVVQRHGPDSYHHDRTLTVNHYFPVPPATFDRDTWTRWLFDTLGLVDVHERMEDFALLDAATEALCPTPPGGEEPLVRPFAPNHGPGRNPYVVHSYAADTDRRTSFRGDLNPEQPAPSATRRGG